MEDNYSRILHLDYYTDTTNYVRTILELLSTDEASIEIRDIIKALYNFSIEKSSSDRINTISEISELFIEKVEFNKDLAVAFAKYAYYFFLKRMMFDAENRDRLIDGLGESIKMFMEYCPESKMVRDNNYGTRGNIGYR